MRTTLRATDKRAIVRVRNAARRLVQAVEEMPEGAKEAHRAVYGDRPDFYHLLLAKWAAERLADELTSIINGWEDA